MEEYILEECPICRGAGLLMHEGGWNVQVECADCSAHTVYVEYEDEDEKAAEAPVADAVVPVLDAAPVETENAAEDAQAAQNVKEVDDDAEA